MSFGEDSLVERIKFASDDALNRGWKVTKEAIGSADPQRQKELTDKAELIYKYPSAEIAKAILFENPSEEQLRFLTGEFLRTEINVFDLYRRVERLDEARRLGEEVFDRSITLEDAALIDRCGDRLNLVRSGEAYSYLRDDNFEKAYQTFSEVEKTFDSMGLKHLQGKNAAVRASIRSANLLSMVDISISKGIFVQDVDANLESAEKYNLESKSFIDSSDLGEQEKSTWMSNFYYNSALVHQFKGNPDRAIQDFRNSLDVSEKGSDYPVQTIILYVKLTGALISAQNPEYMDEIRSNYGIIESFVSKKGGFGVYNPLINPVIERIRDSLK